MIDDYGEIKNKNKEWGKLLYVCSTRYLRYLLSTRERVWWRVESGDGSGMAEVGMGIGRQGTYLLGWSCEMEWNGMNKDEMKMLQDVFVAVAVA